MVVVVSMKGGSIPPQVTALSEQFQSELLCFSERFVSMSTAITVYERNDFAALAEGSAISEAMKENMLPGDKFSEMDLIRVKTPAGGSKYWEVEGDPAPTAEIEGVLVYNAWLGLLWPSMETGSGVKPLVRSNDLIIGKLNMTEEDIAEAVSKGDLSQKMVDELAKHELPNQPGCYRWADLPWMQDGTGKNGIGKFAKENRLLFVLRKSDAWPLVIKAGPGSLASMSRMIKRLGVPQYRAVVSLKLQEDVSRSGVKYSKIIGEQKGSLDAATGAMLKSMYTDPLRASHEAGRVYETVEDAS